MRVVAAAVLAADASALIGWLNDDATGRAALATALLATAGLIGGYLTSETP